MLLLGRLQRASQIGYRVVLRSTGNNGIGEYLPAGLTGFLEFIQNATLFHLSQDVKHFNLADIRNRLLPDEGEDVFLQVHQKMLGIAF